MQMLAGGVLLLLAGLLSGETSLILLGRISVESMMSLAYLTVFGGIIAFPAYIFLLRVSTPAKVSTFAFVNPVIAVFLGWSLGREPLTARTVIASVVIVGAAAVLSLSRSSSASRRQARDRGGTTAAARCKKRQRDDVRLKDGPSLPRVDTTTPRTPSSSVYDCDRRDGSTARAARNGHTAVCECVESEEVDSDEVSVVTQDGVDSLSERQMTLPCIEKNAETPLAQQRRWDPCWVMHYVS